MSPPSVCVRLQVRGMWWSYDDTTLVTAGIDGAVYEWRVLEGRRARDFVQKGLTYTCVVSWLVWDGLLCMSRHAGGQTDGADGM